MADWWNYKHPKYQDVAPQTFPGDKVIVMAKLEEERTDWVEEELPEYVHYRSIPWISWFAKCPSNTIPCWKIVGSVRSTS